MAEREEIEQPNDRGAIGDDRSLWRGVARTHVGLKRSSNQDRFLLDRTGEVFLCAVADGMGGHAGGERASLIALEAFAGNLHGKTPDGTIPLSAPDAGPALEEGVRSAHHAVLAEGQAESDLEGMGTTLVGLLVDDSGGGVLVNVGDSRAYLFRGGELRQVSNDHSLVADLVRSGEITPEEAADHPRRNVLTMAIGIGRTLDPQVEQISSEPGDIWLLASDGLHGMIPDRDIARILSADWSLEAKCSSLVEAALDAGGHDNVTVLLLQRHPKRSAVSGPGTGGRTPAAWLLIPLLLLAVLAILRLISSDGGFDYPTPNPYPVDSLLREIESDTSGLPGGSRSDSLIPDSLRGFDIDRSRRLLDSTVQPTPGDIVDDPRLSDSLSEPVQNRGRRSR